MKQNIISPDGVVLYLPIKMEQVTEIKFEQKYGTHASIEIKGILHKEEKVKDVCEISMRDTILLKKNEDIIFSGVPIYAEAESRGELVEIIIRGSSRSILLDLEKKKKSFQKTVTYKNLIEEIAGESAIVLLQKGLDTKEKTQLHMQYKETDWDFLKRMASQLNAPICPDITAEKNCIFVGIPEGKKQQEDIASYKMARDIGEYLKYKSQDSSISVKEFTTIKMKSYKKYKIGDKISYEGYTFYVVEVKMQYTDGMMEYTYKLGNKDGVKQKKIYNPHISGISINGKIIKVNKDYVKLHLETDRSQRVEEAVYFQVANGYTAEGSTGLYTAMDEGESVKLYFPTSNEGDAYVRCVNKKDSSTSEHFARPAAKCFGTPYGSCVSTDEKGILISNTKDKIFIRMDEDDGIEFHSTENIELYAEKDMDVECKKLELESKDKVILKTDDHIIVVDETVHIRS